ncbi:MAG: DUF1573 domain-containing protein [Taibaiella sp.]|nr:DUF1573 domain-containing protein [Taibaiella sp.]
MLTILTLSVFTLTIVELTGISKNGIFRRYSGGGEGSFYSKTGEIYKGEIYPEQLLTRTQVVAQMTKTTVQFYETKFNFGSVSEGKVLTHSFRFKNTGQNPLMIAKTDVTCGCTVSNFPLETIPPGVDGEISIVYNSSGHSGFQQKNIIVHSNSLPEAVSIGIEANVR